MNREPSLRVGLAALVLLSAVAVSWGPGAEIASACSCEGPESTAEAARRSDVAFTGSLIERMEASAGFVRYVFDVELVHKGAVGARVEVESTSDGASCGAAISDEIPMFVVAGKHGDRLVTGLCSGNTPVVDRPPLLPGYAPAPPADQRQQQPPGTDDVAAGSMAAGAALVVAAVAGALWLARRRAHVE